MKSKVYFSREITPEKVVEMYQKLGVALPGKVAVKVHSGEKGNTNFLRPDFWKPMVEHASLRASSVPIAARGSEVSSTRRT